MMVNTKSTASEFIDQFYDVMRSSKTLYNLTFNNKYWIVQMKAEYLIRKHGYVSNIKSFHWKSVQYFYIYHDNELLLYS